MHPGLGICLLVVVVCTFPQSGTPTVLPRFIASPVLWAMRRFSVRVSSSRDCRTSEDERGLCVSVHQCFRDSRFPTLSGLDRLVSGHYDPCGYLTPNGTAFIGVCCTDPVPEDEGNNTLDDDVKFRVPDFLNITLPSFNFQNILNLWNQPIDKLVSWILVPLRPIIVSLHNATVIAVSAAGNNLTSIINGVTSTSDNDTIEVTSSSAPNTTSAPEITSSVNSITSTATTAPSTSTVRPTIIVKATAKPTLRTKPTTKPTVTTTSTAKPTVSTTSTAKPTVSTTTTTQPIITTMSSGQVGIVGGDETFGMPQVVSGSQHEGPDHLETNRLCGKGALTGIHDKVINGTDTEINQFPWMVAIMGRHLKHVECGGTIIDRRHILTAAHCVIKYKHRPQNMIIHVGEYNISEENETVLVRPVAQEVIIHPDHDRAYYLYDAAIIRLVTPLQFAENVRPICLPFDSSETYTDTVSTVLGWGTTEFGRNPSDVLKHAQLDIISNKKCYDAYIQKYPERITGEVLCAAQTGKDSCQGDSGGPLMVLVNNTDVEAWYQVGIVSWGIRCADDRYPGVYSRLTSILDWVRVATKM